MGENTKIRITTDCVCDLTEDFLNSLDVKAIDFYIDTDSGRFRDGEEITSANVLEYLESGGSKAFTMAPSAEEFRDFFEEAFKSCEEIIHICISSGVSLSYQNATEAVSKMNPGEKKIHIVDSRHLSTGMAFLILKAVFMQREGMSAGEILQALDEMIPHISTTFITVNADYLYRNGRGSSFVKKICSIFGIHPVLGMKDGIITLKKIYIGNYRKAYIRYIRSELRYTGKIDRERAFITHSGCSVKDMGTIKKCVEDRCSFQEIMVTNASATVSGNCGKGAFGILFLNRYAPSEKNLSRKRGM